MTDDDVLDPMIDKLGWGTTLLVGWQKHKDLGSTFHKKCFISGIGIKRVGGLPKFLTCALEWW